MDTLKSMDRSLNANLDDVKGTTIELQTEVEVLKAQVGELQNENKSLKERMSRIENKSDDLESRSRRNNLLFYGMERGQGETNKDCEERLRDLVTDQMELANDVEFDRVHRVGSKPDSPIIARCTFYKDKVAILKAKKKLKGSNIFVGEDFSQGMREVRRKLSTFF